MDSIYNFLSNDWAIALGWTLLHSIWQSLVFLLLVLTALRFFPTTLSRLRYSLACAGFILTFLSSLFTFYYLLNQSNANIRHTHKVEDGIRATVNDAAFEPAINQVISAISRTIDSNMPLIITAWLLGFLFFALRLFSGLIYTYQLRKSVLPLQNIWIQYVGQVASMLGIQRIIQLAESEEINTPIVIGYLKPIILIPVGMLTGLSAEQLETIIIHELAHIKRHDFIINLIQSILETVFFFNPFIWYLSHLIRREREYCCDDMVIHLHGGTRAYARALAQLEEVRLSKNMFALSLAENKNQLLNRIRRIMEKSVKINSGKNRNMIPAIVLVGGLLCASWLTIEQENGLQNGPINSQDTVIKKNEKSAKYFRNRITNVDEKGEPHEEISEKFEGYESLRPLMGLNVIPDVSDILPASTFPPAEVTPVIPPLDFDMLLDSLPHRGFLSRDDQQWEEFSKAFQEKFREKFEEFYSSHGRDLEIMMKELEHKFNSADFPSMEQFELSQKDLEKAARMREETLQHMHEFQNQDAMKDLQRDMEILHENLARIHAEDLMIQSDHEDFQKYDEALRELLIKDGYLSKDEPIKNLEWNDDDSFMVNGVEIKTSDKKKYQALHDKYLNKRHHVRKVE